MQLRVFAVGKLKQPGLEALVAEYCKRGRKLLPIELVHLRDGAALRRRLLEDSGRKRVILDERGQQATSAELAGWLGAWRESGVRAVDFFVGDAHGFCDEERQAGDRVLALSRMTLPHRLAQVLLVEQLYRAGTLLAGHPYHH